MVIPPNGALSKLKEGQTRNALKMLHTEGQMPEIWMIHNII